MDPIHVQLYATIGSIQLPSEFLAFGHSRWNSAQNGWQASFSLRVNFWRGCYVSLSRNGRLTNCFTIFKM